MWPKNLLPTWAAGHAFIAGGFAACPALADDVDVWVSVLDGPSGNEWDNVQAARNRLVTYLHGEFGDAFAEQDGVGSARNGKEGWDRHRLLSTHEGYVMPIPIYRAGSVLVPGASLPYHVIAVGADIDEVLSSFDISTHQVALHSEKGVIRGEHWTPITERGFVLKNKYSTASRLAKLAKRYGWPDA